jgi:hypothetical protein
MKRAFWYTLFVLPWAALAAFALWLWSVWDRLPARLAVHFNFHNVPNGWQTRVQFAEFCLLLLLLMTSVLVIVGWVMRRLAARKNRLAWGVVFSCDALLAMLYVVMVSLVRYNLGEAAMPSPGLIGAGMIAATLGLMFSILANALAQLKRPQREAHWTPPQGPVSRTAGRLLAEEVHSDRRWLLLLIPAAGLMSLRAATVHEWPVPIGLLIAALALILVSGMIWDGFHYRFTTSGLEVRSLGIRLRWVPLPEIKEYRVEEHEFCGYGWRMAPGRQWFIWSGHRGVKVRTWNGDLYLGHARPERLVRDLDAMMKYA